MQPSYNVSKCCFSQLGANFISQVDLKVFGHFWDAVFLRQSDCLNNRISASYEEAIMAFLVSKTW
jgi:hypothetical protein